MEKIDWSKAPEGATHHTEDSDRNVACWIKTGCDYIMHYITVLYHNEKMEAGDNWIPTEDFTAGELIARPITNMNIKPVYTQAMVDAGVMPSVGMECNYETTFFSYTPNNKGVCKILHIALDKVWLDVKGGIDHVLSLDVIKFTPLTPSIELIDGEAYKYIAVDATIENGIYYKGRMCNQHGNVQVANCTNIQLLEIKQ